MKTTRELKRLSRADLLDLLLTQSRELDHLREQLLRTQEKLASRDIAIEKAGSIAEASLELNGVFSAAQSACEQYIHNVQDLKERQEEACRKMEQESREKCEQLEREARSNCTLFRQEAQEKCEQLEQETREKCGQMELDAQEKCRRLEQLTQEKCRRMAEESRRQEDAFWAQTAQQAQSLADSIPGLQERIEKLPRAHTRKETND